MRRLFCVAIAAGLVAATTPAHAFYAEASGWSITGSEDSCGALIDYEGPGNTQLIFVKQIDGTVAISLANDAWSAVAGQKYSVVFVLDDDVYSGGKSIGIISGGQKGFLTIFDPGFERDFASARSLRVLIGEKLIDRLSLTGSTAALAQLNRCLGQLRTELAAGERERQRWADIAKDPFAGGPHDPELIYPASFAARFIMPPAALKEGRTGRAEFLARVAADGTVSSCEIPQSSGHADLDEATCATVRKYGRFKPAIDKDGQPVAGEYRKFIVWGPTP